MEKKSLKLPITLLVLGACWSIVYIIPFIQYIWYDPFQQFMNATNTQMGLLITIYGFGNVFGAPIQLQVYLCRFSTFERYFYSYFCNVSYIFHGSIDVDWLCHRQPADELSHTYQDDP